MGALGDNGTARAEIVRVVDHDVRPGITSDEGEGDEWPAIRELWNQGPGPGESYLESEDGKDWSHEPARAAASNLAAVARALQANPVPPPPG